MSTSHAGARTRRGSKETKSKCLLP
eukprot:COSAG06_NODE_4780_length_3960_cov_25.428904_1_plen_24_part_10